ncbi:MAG: hypothetical protein V4850_33415 [Myxococcota bacterium]
MTETEPTSTLEMALYALSTVVVLVVAGAAVVLDLTAPEDPHPRLEAHVDGPGWDDGTARAVPWVIENVSSHDVERVQVEVRLGDGEPVSQEIDYLPRGALRRGVARLPPVGGEPVVHVAGYRIP